ALPIWLLLQWGVGQLAPYKDKKLKISSINFGHPLYARVFDGKVTNFQYPDVEGSFGFQGSGNQVLSYNNGAGFLINHKHFYIFTAPIDADHSNFERSPLIVPTFYNMGKQSLKVPQLFYTIAQQ